MQLLSLKFRYLHSKVFFMSNNLVGYSRAGDVFHYRWAARRCLKLIYSNSKLYLITVEGSPEIEKAGEYVIDLTESYGTAEEEISIKYYQLKHTTVLKDKPFILSDFKTTIEGFAKRFEQHYVKDEILSRQVSFTIVTNRKIDANVKKNFNNLGDGKAVGKLFKKTLETYTSFDGEKLSEFCSKLNLEDSEADYEGQHAELRVEMARLISGAFESAYVDSVTTLIQEKVLPNSDGRVVKEDVLRRFGIMSELDMYPAEAQWESLAKTIVRAQHEVLINDILESTAPVIIHAEGGIGKSVFARQVVKALPSDSIGIAYDCFGAGSYRNRSTTRHMHRTALVQIANELSAIGLCDPLVVQNTTLAGDIMRDFLSRLNAAITALQQANPDAKLVILIDAADNAEMAANEFNETCFAHELIREQIPQGCKLVFLCRTERIALLQALTSHQRFELVGFDAEESLQNLKNYFPDAQQQDGIEFHRLTNGNPRVQANALDFEADSVAELLMNLGPGGTTVEDQIEAQLTRAVNKIEELSPVGFKDHVNAICLGLASLSPHIPIEVLARAAGIDVATVKSFVADIGRPLWISDLSVQFRDEPTETWFRKKYCASKRDFQNYIALLEPLAANYTYVSQVLPQLYLQAEQYEKLIAIALSEDFLPLDNPIDARSVRVYRLQFAFKAALKLRRFKDAAKLAIRAGEEMAGEDRQLLLLQKNIDLLVLFQDKEKVKEIAFKRQIAGSWPGSENIYCSALLSSVDGYLGEARGFLRASGYWLNVYFEESKKKKRTFHDEERLEDGDILEFALAQLNINGVKGGADVFKRLKPQSAVFEVVKMLVARLIDAGKFETVDEILADLSEYPYYVVGVTYELAKVGRFPQGELLTNCLKKLCNQKTRIKVNMSSYNDTVTPAILCFLEACVHRNLSNRSITKVLNTYFPERATQMVHKSHFKTERELFLGALAIRMHIKKSDTVDLDTILPSNLLKVEKKYDEQNELKEFKHLVFGLSPWYQARMLSITNQLTDLPSAVKEANEKSRAALQGRYRGDDTLPDEINELCISIFQWSSSSTKDELREYYNAYIKTMTGAKAYYQLGLLRASYRLPHLIPFSKEIESETYGLLQSIKHDGPDEIAERFIILSRAVLINSKDDASVYFEEAIEIASKFGYEINQRWDAVVSLAKQSTKTEINNPELAYRFIRIAELVGDNLREKHWSRDEAVQLCLKISAPEGLAALSRWLDRDVGRFERLEEALILQLLDSGKISIETVISLSLFLDIDQLQDFVVRCLDKPISKTDKVKLLQGVLTQLQNEGTSKNYWIAIKEAYHREKLSDKTIGDFLEAFEKVKSGKEPSDSLKFDSEKGDTFDWNKVFGDAGVETADSLNSAIGKFNEKTNDKKNFVPKSAFWRNAVSRVIEATFYDFLDAITETTDFELYDLREIFRAIPDEWKRKASFGKKFAVMLTRIGQKFGYELVIPYQLKSVRDDLNLSSEQINTLRNGVFDNLAVGNEFANAEMLFGFVDLSSQYLDQEDALELLNYALARFEMHVEDDFADGPYSPDNELTTTDVEKSIAGFIFSSLGSPMSIIRWKAAHCVWNLIKYKCTTFVDALFYWLQRNAIGSFGAKQFPFYNLHARQFLMIAFSRSSFENSSIFEPYATILYDYAVNKKHAVIQKYAVDIALNIHAMSPEIYSADEITSLKNVLISPHHAVKGDFNYSVDSYLHQKREFDRENNFHFGWDFHQYWFAPLGRVFGVSADQIEDLASIVVADLWGTVEGGYYKDPRVGLWNNSSDRNGTHHDHGSYPRTDDLDFYMSYHAMMIVASDLLANMPTIAWRDGDEDDKWPYWLSRHLTTRDDGKWLSDFRDPVPLHTSDWLRQERYGKEALEIADKEFLESLIVSSDGEVWLNVKGSLQENNGSVNGTCYIASAFVSAFTSDSLLNALSTCVDFRDFKLPAYKERNMEIRSGEFVLTGWIDERNSAKSIDEFDPLAGEIEYPPYRIGKKIQKAAGLTVSEDGKKWYEAGSSEPILISQMYASQNRSKDDAPEQSGNVIRAKLSFLKNLCSILKCDLIFEVQIQRNFIHRYRTDKNAYREAVNKIFILSQDGKIRNTTEDHQLG
jgi:hypothetical protein